MSQSPEPYFLYFYEWGEGGLNILTYKSDQITSINTADDGYLLELFTICEDGNPCTRYQKINLAGNEKWRIDFNHIDTSFIGSIGIQNNWVVENKYYTLGRFRPDGNDTLESIQYSIFDVATGKMDFKKQCLSSDIGLIGLSYFDLYQDSLFIFGQSHELEPGRDIPAFRMMNKKGEIVRSVNANSYFDENTTLTTSFKENTEGNFNIISVQRDYFTTTAGFLFAGICDPNGNKKTHFATGDHTAGGYPREVTFENGNRFLVAVIDTLWDDIFNESKLFKTYYLKPNGEVIKDSLYYSGDTTYYLVDVMLCENGDALIVGNARTESIITDDRGAIFLIRVNPQGETIWHKKYSPFLFSPSSRNFVQVLHIKEDSDNGILISGHMSRVLDTLLDKRERMGFLLKLDQNGCYDTDCNGGNILLSTKPPIPINLLPAVSVFPNPADDLLQINIPSGKEYNWKLYDTQGRQVDQGFGFRETTTQINTMPLHNGTYFLQIQFAKGIVNKQILIMR